MDKAHMDDLECMIVYGIIPSDSDSASISLATPMICAISLRSLTARFLVRKNNY